MDKDQQILKTRDDKAPVILSRVAAPAGTAESFKLAAGSECSWLQADSPCDSAKLRSRIEPWLTALFQSEHFALLVGSGLSHAVHRVATGQILPSMEPVKFTHFDAEINAEAKKSAKLAGRADGNIEDQIRVANELLRGGEIIAGEDQALQQKIAGLKENLKGVLENLAASVLKGENGLITAEKERLEKAFNYLVSFLMSFASRTGTRDRLQVFTTNYDRFIEAGSEVAGLHLLDRFVGSLSPIFRSSRLDVDMHYNPPGIRGEPRYLKC
jgi:hypothetical protein